MRRRRRILPPIVQVDVPAAFDRWTYAAFKRSDVSAEGGIRDVSGWTLGGLGLHISSWIRARHKRKDGTRRLDMSWTVIHLNTGHPVVTLRNIGPIEAFTAATEILELTETWEFDGLDGWKNRDPELGEKIAAWIKRNAKLAYRGRGGSSEAIAQAIGMSRL